MEEAEHLHLALKRGKRLCVSVRVRVCACVCVRERKRVGESAREYACYFLYPLSYPDPFQVHCIVSLIYVAPHLHLPTMSTL